MGNREDLLAAATTCLYSKGFARTTARDVATTAGVSLAAIGYHFGSKEKLLTLALQEAVGAWGRELGTALAAADGATPAERFDETWRRVIDSFGRNSRLWAVQFEVLGSLDAQPELKATLAAANEQAREALAAMVGDDVPGAGGLYHALIGGLAAQWLVDPDGVQSPEELQAAVVATAEHLRR